LSQVTQMVIHDVNDWDFIEEWSPTNPISNEASRRRWIPVPNRGGPRKGDFY